MKCQDEHDDLYNQVEAYWHKKCPVIIKSRQAIEKMEKMQQTKEGEKELEDNIVLCYQTLFAYALLACIVIALS